MKRKEVIKERLGSDRILNGVMNKHTDCPSSPGGRVERVNDTSWQKSVEYQVHWILFAVQGFQDVKRLLSLQWSATVEKRHRDFSAL